MLNITVKPSSGDTQALGNRFSGIKEVETICRSKLQKLDVTQVLGQEVCWVFISVDKIEFRELTLNYFPNVVVADIYVFGPFFGHRITGDEYRALVIPTYRYGV